MKFSLNVKPLKDAMDLGIINGNISKFFEKSTVVELSVSGNELQLNTQATSLLSEAVIKGNNEDGQEAYAIVDCVLFKSLIGSLDYRRCCCNGAAAANGRTNADERGNIVFNIHNFA